MSHIFSSLRLVSMVARVLDGYTSFLDALLNDFLVSLHDGRQ